MNSPVDTDLRYSCPGGLELSMKWTDTDRPQAWAGGDRLLAEGVRRELARTCQEQSFIPLKPIPRNKICSEMSRGAFLNGNFPNSDYIDDLALLAKKRKAYLEIVILKFKLRALPTKYHFDRNCQKYVSLYTCQLERVKQINKFELISLELDCTGVTPSVATPPRQDSTFAERLI
ncbi:hypothetical protein J6590_011903 [Homalodisca vitripennis]|nr:hypothetical protein J6590_011903 [Homalodisca vitripennis]